MTTMTVFLPVIEYTMMKLFICLTFQNRWEVKHFDFQKAFPNRKLDRPVYVEPEKQILGEGKRSTVVMRLHGSLFGLKDASETWFELIRERFGAAGMKEMHSAPCIFQGNSIIAVCFVDHLLVFGKKKQKIDQLKTRLEKDLMMKDLERQRSFLGVEMS